MGVLSTIKSERRSRVTSGTELSKPASWLMRMLGIGESTTSGVDVNEYTAMNLSAFWCAVRNISEDVAKLPVGVYQREEAVRRELPDDPVAVLLNREPSVECLPISFRETMTSYALTWGNGVAEIEWFNNGRPAALWQQKPTDVNICRDRQKRIVYEINSARDGGKTKSLTADNVFHLHGLGFDGITGYSIVSKARESLGLSMAAERFGSGFFGNGAVVSGVLEHPMKLTDGGKRIKESWEEKHKGPSKARGLAILEEGMKYHQIGIPPEDGQFLETRQFQIAEIARWFRMPPHKLMDLLRGTFSNIEHQSIEYVGDCLEPWLIRWEQEGQRKFFGKADRRYLRHNTAALLRSDTESRYRAHAIARQWGWRSPDDVRAIEDENPLPDGQGKTYLVPSNMVPADKIGEVTDALIKGKGQSGPSDPPPTNPENGNQNRARDVAQAMRSQILEAIQRLARAASDKVKRAQKRDGFSSWYQSFLQEHRDHVKGAFFPIAEAIASLRAALGSADLVFIPPASIADNMADRYMLSIRDGFPDNFESTAPNTLADAEVRHIEAIIPGGTP